MKGKIIVIDGMDGVGKNTQVTLLVKKLKEEGKLVKSFSFPNYKNDSSFFVKKFLNGEYNDIENPYIISLFYSLDRGITFAREIKQFYDQGYIIILDRYYISNILYQLHNLETYSDKLLYIHFLGIVEINGCKLPKPNINIILYSRPEVSNLLLNNRYNNDDDKRDIYENIEMQNNVYSNIDFIDKYKDLISMKNTLGKIETICIHDAEGNIFDREYINEKLIELINDVIEK